ADRSAPGRKGLAPVILATLRQRMREAGAPRSIELVQLGLGCVAQELAVPGDQCPAAIGFHQRDGGEGRKLLYGAASAASLLEDLQELGVHMRRFHGDDDRIAWIGR